MNKIFTKDFLKFLLGFTGLIAAALLLLFLLQGQVDATVDQPDSMQTLPATTTGQ